MKKIVVPCDFSEPAIEAFKFALEIAHHSKGEILLLNVVEIPVIHDTMIVPTLYMEDVFFKEIKAQSEKKFNQMRDKWAKEDIAISYFVEFGSTTTTIREFIKKKDADLVVMGTHGTSGLREFFVGSNTEKILRTSDVPVITIKKSVKTNSITNIVFPSSLHEEQEELVHYVKKIQGFFKATLHLVHINTPALFMRDSITRKKLKDFGNSYSLKNFTINIYNDLDEQAGIHNFTKEIGGDMLVMATHGRRGLNHFLSGSIAEDIANHIECPIWTMKIK
jgi:nucleotide-binding universal stress UspA family protein